VSAPFVIGVDFGTESARALVFDVKRGREIPATGGAPGAPLKRLAEVGHQTSRPGPDGPHNHRSRHDRIGD
jgi:hypothetical protein